MEFILGGVAAVGATIFTNPLEVVKTRLQLQGELQARGLYTVHYKNVFHGIYAVAKADGLLALQKGLVPALWYQWVMNGIRLGVYQYVEDRGYLKKADDSTTVSPVRSIIAGAATGCLGAATASPLYLVKTHLQSQAAKQIAVGYQHHHDGMSSALSRIYGQHGLLGLWRGVSAAILRVTFGSAAQLSTFSKCKDILDKEVTLFTPGNYFNVFVASMLSGLVVTLVMTPFDVVSTRMYNQGVDTRGRGIYYTGVADCFVKVVRTESPLALYKGWTASYMRVGPHCVLSLVIWQEVRDVFQTVKNSSRSNIASAAEETRS